MSWFADLAGKAENLLNNIDEQTGAALRNHNINRFKLDRNAPHSEGNWGQKSKRPFVKNIRKQPITETKSSPQSKRTSPAHSQLNTFKKPVFTDKQINPGKTQVNAERHGVKLRKSPEKKIKSPQFNLNHCPRTLVGDIPGDCQYVDQYKYNNRSEYKAGSTQKAERNGDRHSYPTDLALLDDNNDDTIRMQDLEVENAMLKNELNVMNGEALELLGKLRASEEGNDVVRNDEECSSANTRLDESEVKYFNISIERDALASQLENLKRKVHEITKLEHNYQGEKQKLLIDNSLLKDVNISLEERVKDLAKKLKDAEATQHRLEAELRHTQSTVVQLTTNLEKSNIECKRLEKDWETYKLRVKSMLYAKDDEIKSLQEGANLTEDTKVLVEQLECLKEERDELSDAISAVRNECDSIKQYLSQVEGRHTAAERLVAGLRDALRDERAVRNKAEAHCVAISKELKNIQVETGQTIANLRTALRDKEAEMTQLRESSSSIKSTDTSALNVADYDVRDTIDNEKIHYLTETLVQRQGKVDRLLAENNVLRIQMDKLESKLKQEVSSRTNHSIVHVQTEGRSRSVARSRWRPSRRLLLIIYLICLHFWVVTVLLTSTPAENVPKSSRS